MVTLTELPPHVDDPEFLALGTPCEHGTAFFSSLITESTWIGSGQGRPKAESFHLLNSFSCDELWHFAASLFNNVNTCKMVLITEAAWISSVCWWGGHKEERFLSQACHWYIWYWVGRVKRHPEKCMVFDCFLRVLVFLLQTKYRKKPDTIKFTTVVDSPDLVHAKNSYMHCNEVGVFCSLIPGLIGGRAAQWSVLKM